MEAPSAVVSFLLIIMIWFLSSRLGWLTSYLASKSREAQESKVEEKSARYSSRHFQLETGTWQTARGRDEIVRVGPPGFFHRYVMRIVSFAWMHTHTVDLSMNLFGYQCTICVEYILSNHINMHGCRMQEARFKVAFKRLLVWNGRGRTLVYNTRSWLPWHAHYAREKYTNQIETFLLEKAEFSFFFFLFLFLVGSIQRIGIPDHPLDSSRPPSLPPSLLTKV